MFSLLKEVTKKYHFKDVAMYVSVKKRAITKVCRVTQWCYVCPVQGHTRKLSRYIQASIDDPSGFKWDQAWETSLMYV